MDHKYSPVGTGFEHNLNVQDVFKHLETHPNILGLDLHINEANIAQELACTRAVEAFFKRRLGECNRIAKEQKHTKKAASLEDKQAELLKQLAEIKAKMEAANVVPTTPEEVK